MVGIFPHVRKYVDRLITAESTADADETCAAHFNVKLGDAASRAKAEREHNAFVCSKEPEGWHLNTGHIFTIKDDLWVCLSPACDMVPSQMSKERRCAFGDRLPFMAVKLWPLQDGRASPKDIQSNRYVFLQLNGNVKGYCFNNPSGENSAADWQMLYAEKLGEFVNNFELKVIVTELGAKRLISNRHGSKVVAQLRYEYALNLMHRLGASMTRVGLDFVGLAAG